MNLTAPGHSFPPPSFTQEVEERQLESASSLLSAEIAQLSGKSDGGGGVAVRLGGGLD